MQNDVNHFLSIINISTRPVLNNLKVTRLQILRRNITNQIRRINSKLSELEEKFPDYYSDGFDR